MFMRTSRLQQALLALAAVITLGWVQPGNAAGTIQGFEAGDPVVTKTGDASAQGAIEGISPPQGTQQYVITTLNANDPEFQTPVSGVDAVAHPALQNFFNNNIGGSVGTLPDVEGSGFYFTFTLAPGEMGVSFLYDFLTNEDRPTAVDTAFYVLYSGSPGSATLLSGPTAIATFNDATNLLASPNKFTFESGYTSGMISIASPGTYTLAIGIYDKGDDDHNSALLIDNFVAVIPEPSTVAFCIAGAALLGALRTRIKRKS
jgi:hypothetical protein